MCAGLLVLALLAAPGGEDSKSALHQALALERLPKAPVQVRYFFSYRDGQTMLVASVNVRPSNVLPKTGRYQVLAEFMGLASARNLADGSIGAEHQHLYREPFSPSRWETLVADPRAFLQYNLAMPLAPGRYRWELIWRDLNSGREGLYGRVVEVPNLKKRSAPSTMVLSLISPFGRERLIAAEQNRTFTTSPDGVFCHGETIVAQYEVANATKADFKRAGEMKATVFREGQPEAVFETECQSRKVRKLRLLRFKAQVPTGELEPGKYRLRASLPGGSPGYLEESFTIVLK